MTKLTPMLQQYYDIKNAHPDAILFFRLGDFYEMFGQDAIDAAHILNITLTARNKGSETETPMCGVPHHAAAGYIAKLTKAGKKVAICEQTSDPTEPGIVEREVVRIITPGTTIDETLLIPGKHNYLASIYKGTRYGCAFADLTTGECKVFECTSKETLEQELFRLAPAEVLLEPDTELSLEDFTSFGYIQECSPDTLKDHKKILCDHFQVKTLDGFGIEKMSDAIHAAGNLLQYLKETQKSALSHIHAIGVYSISDFMILDQATIRNLELLRNNSTFTEEGSLISVLDKTKTGMGGRTLRHWLLHPLLDKKEISRRHAIVQVLTQHPAHLEQVRHELKQISDIERLMGKIGCARANAKDLYNLRISLQQIPSLIQSLNGVSLPELTTLLETIDHHIEVIDIIATAIAEDPPVSTTEGGMIANGYNTELDELRSISKNGKQWLADLQIKESEKTGISSLKVKFNKVFGYYIEVSKANLSQVPDSYIRKQTLVNAERFITPELKEFEEKILSAEEKIVVLEQQLFLHIRDQVLEQVTQLQKTAQTIGILDALSSFAHVAITHNYTCPEITADGRIVYEEGRHPVIEIMHKNEQYVSNDGLLNHSDHEFILLTGPNMSGKSSYLRQTALISLMTQIGSFVPAKKALMSIVDRIFTRVGASDNLSRGLSTFMVEMQEAANILHNATKDSLIILDELGRGTATYDGVSIAWALMEYIHNTIGAKTLFATHYHELVEIADELERAQNYSVAVKEKNDRVIFLRKIIPGAVDKSYGIEVAKIAGFPEAITERAAHILQELESHHHGKALHQTALPITDSTKDTLREELAQINTDEISPKEALSLLEKLQKIK